MGKCILFQGDSITDCSRSRETGDWGVNNCGFGYALLSRARLMAAHPEKDLSIYNRGISGNRVVDLYARWKIDALKLKPDIITILIGINETWHEKYYQNGVDLERYEQVYRMLLEWTKKVLPGVKLILLEPFVLPFGAAAADWVPDVEARAGIVRRVAADFQAEFIPLLEKFRALSQGPYGKYYLVDGVHPTNAGHQVISDALVPVIEKFL